MLRVCKSCFYKRFLFLFILSGRLGVCIYCANNIVYKFVIISWPHESGTSCNKENYLELCKFHSTISNLQRRIYYSQAHDSSVA